MNQGVVDSLTGLTNSLRNGQTTSDERFRMLTDMVHAVEITVEKQRKRIYRLEQQVAKRNRVIQELKDRIESREYEAY